MASWSAPLALPLRYRVGGYREFTPPPALLRLAEAVWTHRTPASLPPGAPRFHRVLPDPALTLAFSCHRDPQGRVARGQLAVVGPTTFPRRFQFCPGEELVAVRLKLEWARPLLGLEPLEHANRADDADGPLPGLSRSALPALLASRHLAEALQQLTAAVLAMDDGRLLGLAPRAVELVRRSRGALSMDAVAFQLGTSGRQLRRRMQQEVGIGLKGFARVLRLLRVVTEADRTERPAWAHLAAEAGFADQAHLVRECRTLSGLSPLELFRERRAQLDEEGRKLQAWPEMAAVDRRGMSAHPIRGVLAALLLAPLLSLGAPRGDATARVEPVADGVWAIVHDNATEEWPHGNTGVIIGDNGVLVVDSTYLPSRARQTSRSSTS